MTWTVGWPTTRVRRADEEEAVANAQVREGQEWSLLIGQAPMPD